MDEFDWKAEAARLRAERDEAVRMLAGWCVAVRKGGTGWDDWDDFYKDAAYRECGIRALLDSAIAQAEKLYE